MKSGLRLIILSFTDRGADLADRVKKTDLFIATHRRCAGGRLKEMVKEAFAECDAILFIGATGIAVRAIAPFVKSKLTDPAVLVADERGRFIIPILSGHVGGANEIAETLAEHLEMTAVITTATDINGVISIDSWAVRHHLFIENASKIKDVSMKVLRGEKIRVLSDISLDDVPPEFEPVCKCDGASSGPPEISCPPETSCSSEAPCPPDVYIGPRKLDFLRESSLCLTPKVLFVGIGCRRGTPESEIAAFFEEVFALHHLSRNAVAGVASIDLKADEEGLLRFCGGQGFPVHFFTGEELMQVEGEYEFSSSHFVKKTTGVDSVCERAAVRLAETRGADFSRRRVQFIQKKIAKNGVTIAIAISE